MNVKEGDIAVVINNPGNNGRLCEVVRPGPLTLDGLPMWVIRPLTSMIVKKGINKGKEMPPGKLGIIADFRLKPLQEPPAEEAEHRKHELPLSV